MHTSSPSSCSLSSLYAASTTHWLSPLVLPSLLPYPHGFFRLCSVISAAVLSSPCLFPLLFLPSCSRVQSRPQQLAMDHNWWCSACVLEINIEQKNNYGGHFIGADWSSISLCTQERIVHCLFTKFFWASITNFIPMLYGAVVWHVCQYVSSSCNIQQHTAHGYCTHTQQGLIELRSCERVCKYSVDGQM